jgi:hypothetical protein
VIQCFTEKYISGSCGLYIEYYMNVDVKSNVIKFLCCNLWQCIKADGKLKFCIVGNL